MTYKDFLTQCWKEHLLEKENNAPTVISTFAGAGGSSLGYSMAGFRELLAVEIDNNAVETFKANFSDVPVFHGDIKKLSVEDVFNLTGIKKGELDIFDGSPPCQGFSTTGKRQLDDPRNYLFREYERLIKGIQPKVFVMENVGGMVKGKMKIIFSEIFEALENCGYKVSVRLLNAKYFHVPQSRNRLIFLGVRNDLNTLPSHPKAKSKIISVKEALKNLENDKEKAWELKKGTKTYNIWSYTKPGCSMANFNSRLKIDPKLPSPTQVKSTPHFHWEEPRQMSSKEIARIGSFPDEFIFLGNREKINNRIGNSVPPLFMREIALHIKKEILKYE